VLINGDPPTPGTSSQRFSQASTSSSHLSQSNELSDWALPSFQFQLADPCLPFCPEDADISFFSTVTDLTQSYVTHICNCNYLYIHACLKIPLSLLPRAAQGTEHILATNATSGRERTQLRVCHWHVPSRTAKERVACE
jgi:hypothetical protein